VLKRKEKEHKHEENAACKISVTQKHFFTKFLIFIFLLLNSVNFCYSEESKVNPDIAQNDLATIKISELEDTVFHEKYTAEKIEDRLGRLENFLFGKQYSSSTINDRLQKLSSALNLKSTENTNIPPETVTAKATPESEQKEDNEPKVVYDESFNSGVIGAVSQIEKRVFGKTFNEYTFQKRVENLELRILNRAEIAKNKNKTLIERVTYLVRRTGISTVNPNIPVISPQANPQVTQSYTIDPNTGNLINEATGEPIKDSYGNPIQVKIPSVLKQNPANSPGIYNQFPQTQQQFTQPQNPQPYGNVLPQNQFPNSLPYGNQFPAPGFPPQQQFPYDFLFNQGVGGGLDPGNDPNY
jgi:hypothetical protein